MRPEQSGQKDLRSAPCHTVHVEKRGQSFTDAVQPQQERLIKSECVRPALGKTLLSRRCYTGTVVHSLPCEAR